jgi:hypothetical protein
MPVTHYVSRSGQPVPIHDFQQLCFVVQHREVVAETMVFDSFRQVWLPAGQTEDFHRALNTRSSSSKAPWVVAAVLAGIAAFVIAAVVVGVMTYRKRQEELRAAANQALRASEKLAVTMGDKPGRTSEAATLPGNLGVVPNGDVATAMRFIASEMEKSQAVTAELVKEHDALDLASVLKPETLTSADGIRRSRETIAAYDRYLAHYETAVKDDRKRIETDAAQLDVSASFRRGFLEGMHKAQDRNAELSTEFLSIEHRLVTTTNEVLDFMSARLGKVTESGGSLRFRSNADVTRYNGLIERIQQLSRDEQDVSQRMAEARQETRSGIEAVVQAAGGK